MIRKAEPGDVVAMIALAEARRHQYQQYQPVFWRKAPDSAEKQSPFLTQQLSSERVIARVFEREGRIDGFVIGQLVPAPPVYAPGGPVLSVDDYCIASGTDWEATGRPLLEAVEAAARERGAVLTVVVCGHLDEPKRSMLRGQGFTIASEWYVRSL